MKIKKIFHYGNTANNAYSNYSIFDKSLAGNIEQRIFEFGLTHAISSPAWEELSFTVTNSKWIEKPNWEDIAGAKQLNKILENKKIILIPDGFVSQIIKILTRLPFVKNLTRLLFVKNLTRLLFVKNLIIPTIVLLIYFLKKKPSISSDKCGEVSIVYGNNFMALLNLTRGRKGKLIAFDHGTFRWSRSLSKSAYERILKWNYRRQIVKCDFAFVTNIDPESITATKRLFGDKWFALPHPYTPNSSTPYQTDQAIRSKLLEDLKSDYLIILASSHNWSHLHDKGTIKAINAFRQLRQSGVKVGLITMEWGLQVDDSVNFFYKNGISEYVLWKKPLPRLNLQQLASNCDISWNQFAYKGIGAFDIRMLEQGIPHVSAGLDSEGARLVGRNTPWYHAINEGEIIDQSTSIIEQIAKSGRESVLLQHSTIYREWLNTYHSPEVVFKIEKFAIESAEDLFAKDPQAAAGYWGEITRRNKADKS
jgi:hypothetical protein